MSALFEDRWSQVAQILQDLKKCSLGETKKNMCHFWQVAPKIWFVQNLLSFFLSLKTKLEGNLAIGTHTSQFKNITFFETLCTCNLYHSLSFK